MLYSVKALHKDVRFSNVFTDVNGPAKFQKCDNGKTSTNWEDYCHKKKYQDPPRQLNDHKLDEYQSFFQDEPNHQIFGSNLTYTACELFYKIANSEQWKSFLPDRRRRIRNLQDNNLECFAEVTLEFLDHQSKVLYFFNKVSF